jgi:hypothetical protein
VPIFRYSKKTTEVTESNWYKIYKTLKCEEKERKRRRKIKQRQ